MARKFGANCSKCQRSTEQQQSIKCFKIHGKDLLQNNDFHITSSIFLLSSVLVFYFFLILFFNSIVYRFFIARIFGVLPEYFRDWGGCRPPRPPGSYAYVYDKIRLSFAAVYSSGPYKNFCRCGFALTSVSYNNCSLIFCLCKIVTVACKRPPRNCSFVPKPTFFSRLNKIKIEKKRGPSLSLSHFCFGE